MMYEIRNRQHKYLANYYSKNPKEALHKFMRDQMVQASQLKGMKIIPITEIYAVEIPMNNPS